MRSGHAREAPLRAGGRTRQCMDTWLVCYHRRERRAMPRKEEGRGSDRCPAAPVRLLHESVDFDAVGADRVDRRTGQVRRIITDELTVVLIAALIRGDIERSVCAHTYIIVIA